LEPAPTRPVLLVFTLVHPLSALVRAMGGAQRARKELAHDVRVRGNPLRERTPNANGG
jgi:hypothetical protein